MAETITQATIRLNADTKNLKTGLNKGENFITSFEKKLEQKRRDTLNKQLKQTENTYKKEVKFTQEKYRKMLSEARKNGEDTNKIWKKFARDREEIEKRTAKNINRIRNKADKQAGAVGGGKTGGAMAMMGGLPGVGAFAGVAGGIALVTKAFDELAEAGKRAGEVEKQMRTLQTVATDFDISGLQGQLYSIAQETGQSIDELIKTATEAVDAGVAKTNADVVKFTEATSKLAVSLGLDMQSASDEMLKFMNATGMTVEHSGELTDMLQTLAIAGDFKSPDEMLSAITKIAPAMTEIGLSQKDIAAITASWTAQGGSVRKLQGTIQQLGNSLQDVTKLNKFRELGVEGIDFVNGKITDMGLFLDSIQSKGKEAQTVLSETGNVNMAVFLENLQDSEKGLDSMLSVFDNMSGRANQAFQTIAETTDVTNKRITAQFDQLQVGVGQAWNDITMGFKSGVIGAFELFGDDIQDIIGDPIENAFNHALNVERYQGLIGNINASLTAIDAGNIEGAFSIVNQNMDEINKLAPVTAQELRDLMSDPSKMTGDELERVKQLLADVQAGAETMGEAEGILTATQAVKGLSNNLDELGSSKLWDVGTESLDEMTERLGDLERGSEEWLDLQQEIAREQSRQLQFQAEINKSAEALVKSGLEMKDIESVVVAQYGKESEITKLILQTVSKQKQEQIDIARETQAKAEQELLYKQYASQDTGQLSKIQQELSVEKQKTLEILKQLEMKAGTTQADITTARAEGTPEGTMRAEKLALSLSEYNKQIDEAKKRLGEIDKKQSEIAVVMEKRLETQNGINEASDDENEIADDTHDTVQEQEKTAEKLAELENERVSVADKVRVGVIDSVEANKELLNIEIKRLEIMRASGASEDEIKKQLQLIKDLNVDIKTNEAKISKEKERQNQSQKDISKSMKTTAQQTVEVVSRVSTLVKDYEKQKELKQKEKDIQDEIIKINETQIGIEIDRGKKLLMVMGIKKNSLDIDKQTQRVSAEQSEALLQSQIKYASLVRKLNEDIASASNTEVALKEESLKKELASLDYGRAKGTATVDELQKVKEIKFELEEIEQRQIVAKRAKQDELKLFREELTEELKNIKLKEKKEKINKFSAEQNKLILDGINNQREGLRETIAIIEQELEILRATDATEAEINNKLKEKILAEEQYLQFQKESKAVAVDENGELIFGTDKLSEQLSTQNEILAVERELNDNVLAQINEKYQDQVDFFNIQIENLRESQQKSDEILGIQRASLMNAKLHTVELQLQGATDEQIKESLNEEKRISQEIKQTEQQITAEKEAQIQNVASTVGQMNSLVGSAVSFINVLKQGNASVSGMMSSLGGIASQFGVYGQIAGGVLSIGSAIASIWSDEEENRKSTLDIQKDLNALMDKHLQLLKQARDAGADVLQSKKNELEYLEQNYKVQQNILIPLHGQYRDAKGIKEFTEQELVYKIKQLELQQALGRELSDSQQYQLEALNQELGMRAQIQDAWEETVKQEMDSFDRQIEAGIKVNKNLQAKLQYMQEILKSSKFQNMTLEEQRDFYDEMLESIEKLSESNADLAQEQLNALKEQIQAHLNLLEIQKLELEAQKELIENSDLPEWAKEFALKNANKQYDAINDAIDEANNSLVQTEKTEKQILEDSRDTALLKLKLRGYSEDSLKYVQTQYEYEKQILEQMKQQGASDKEIYEQMLVIKELSEDYNELLKQGNASTAQMLSNELELLSTKSRMLDLQKDLGQWENKITWYYKQKIEIARRELEILIANKRTNSDVNNILAKQLEIQQLQKQMIDEIYDRNVRDIEHRKAIGEYLENENQYYEDILKVLYAKLEAMKAEGMEGRELYDIQEQIYDIEKKQTDEMMNRNRVHDKELDRLQKKRQELLKQYRITGQGGEAIRDIEMEIRARLESQGVPQNEIEMTMEAFRNQKSYAVGGWVEDTGLANVHAGELILNESQQKNLMENLISNKEMQKYQWENLPSVTAMQFPELPDLMQAMTGNTTNNTLSIMDGAIRVDINVGSLSNGEQVGKDIGKKITDEIETYLIRNGLSTASLRGG